MTPKKCEMLFEIEKKIKQKLKKLKIFQKSLAQVFPVNFAKFLRTPFLQNTSGRLLLHGEVYTVNQETF